MDDCPLNINANANCEVIYCNHGFGLVTRVKSTLKVQLKTNPWLGEG
jgi:hypothetical protein